MSPHVPHLCPQPVTPRLTEAAADQPEDAPEGTEGGRDGLIRGSRLRGAGEDTGLHGSGAARRRGC